MEWKYKNTHKKLFSAIMI